MAITRSIFIYLMFIIVYDGFGQCYIPVDSQIISNSVQDFQAVVSGALNDNLASNGQGVCSVTLHFEHAYIGNLQIELISPSGQSVMLVGTHVTSFNTSGTSWDVTFVPCGSTALPDPGLNPTWNNLGNWSIGSNYTGSYYPFFGCLEDFNLGPVNGTWTLSTDNEIFYTGFLNSFSIEFCDNAGITCTYCNPPKIIRNDTDLSFCEKDTTLNYLFNYAFDQIPNSSSEYSLKYLWVQEDYIEAITDPSMSNTVRSGQYDLYPIYVINEEVNEVDNWLLQSIFDIQDLIEQKVVCASMINAPIRILIHPSYYLDTFNYQKCIRDTLWINNTPLLDDGFYVFDLQSNYGCDSIVNVQVSNISVKTDLPFTALDCDNLSVTIDTSSFEISPSNSLLLGMQWVDEQGNLLSSLPRLTVTDGGYFTLKISVLAGSITCNFDTTIFIPEGFSTPSDPVIFQSKICAEMGGFVYLNADTSRLDINWVFNGQPVIQPHGDSMNLIWPDPGLYSVCAQSLGLCKNSDTICVNILVDSLESFSIIGDSITCSGSFNLEVVGENPDLIWSLDQGLALWSVSENGDLLQGKFIDGEHELQISGTGWINGCPIAIEKKFELVQLETITPFLNDTVICDQANIAWKINNLHQIDTVYYTFEGIHSKLVVNNGSVEIAINVDTSTVLVIDSTHSQYLYCQNYNPFSINIDVQELTKSNFPDTLFLCNADDYDGLSRYDINDFILSGNRVGVWDFSTLSGSILMGDTIDVSNVNSGVYKIIFLSEETLPCVAQESSIVIVIQPCSCPIPGLIDTLSFANSFCDNYGLIDLDTLSNSSVLGSWWLYDESQNLFTQISNLVNTTSLGVGMHPIKFIANEDWEKRCPDSALMTLNIVENPNAGIDTTIIICNDESPILLDNYRKLFGGEWSIADFGPNQSSLVLDFSNNTLNILNDSEGNFYLNYIIAGNERCKNDTAIICIRVVKLSIPFLEGSSYLNCYTHQTEISINDLNQGNLFSWTLNGLLISTDSFAIVNDTGSLHFSVIESQSGCQIDTFFEISNFVTPITTVDINAEKTNCEDETINIEVLNIDGGSGSYQYSLDSIVFTSNSVFEAIQPFNLHLYIRDKYNCVFDTILNFESLANNGFRLPEDTTIIKGSELFVIPIGNNNNASFNNYKWFENGIQTSIQDTLKLRPQVTTFIELLATDVAGCTYFDEMVVVVSNNVEIFVPSAFSPNSDGVNDIFFIPAHPFIDNVDRLYIYSRWGEQVFGNENFPAGDVAYGWDGSLNGQLLNPGVFVYKLIFSDYFGNKHEQYGSIQLIR